MHNEKYNNDEQRELEHEDDTQERKGLAGFFNRHGHVFAVSAAVHLFLLLVISLLSVDKSKPVEPIIVKSLNYKPVEIEAPEVLEIKPPEIENIDVTPMVTDSSADIEPGCTFDDNPAPKEVTESIESLVEHVQSDSPSQNVAMMGVEGLGVMSGIGSGTGLSEGPGGPGRPNKSECITTYEVPKDTLNAVAKALKWLAEHQSKDGSWDVEKYEGHNNRQTIESVTAAAILAFLGEGYSERSGKYKKTISKGIAFLNKAVNAKKERPHFGNNYGSAIILMALAESSMFGSSSTTAHNANRITKMFLDQYNGEGWHYSGPGHDLSVSGWIALGLKSALSAEIPAMKTEQGRNVLEGYKKWIASKATSSETGMGYYSPGRGGSPHMTWVGVFQRKFLDFPKDDIFYKKAAEHSMKWIESKKWVGGEKMGDIYGVYYGTLACFQQQGRLWKVWDKAMFRTLVGSQCKGPASELGGSWDPTAGHTAQKGGRVLTTALSAMCLEVYYRKGLF